MEFCLKHTVQIVYVSYQSRIYSKTHNLGILTECVHPIEICTFSYQSVHPPPLLAAGAGGG